VIDMDSPRLWEGRITWQTVAQHAFGHVLALTRTAKQVPHWFTEGLSVVLEDHPPLLKEDRLARSALMEDELIPFTGLNHGFTRAKNRPQRSLAYYQSAFAVRRLIEQHGFSKVLEFLDDYAAGLSNAEVVAHRLGVSEEAWAEEVDRAIRAHVEALPLWAFASGERLTERVEESQASPEDLDARTRMAEEWLQSGELETALSEALAVLEADSTHAEARLLLGHTLLLQGEPYSAAVELESLLDRQEIDYLVVRDLGLAYADLGHDEAAVPYLEEAIRIYPVDPAPYRKLADLHERAGRMSEAAAWLTAVTEIEEEPFDDLMALADLAGEHELREAEAEALERSLAVRPFERDTVARLARLYDDAGEAAQAVRTYEVLCLLDPHDITAHTALVELALEHGPQETARRYAERLLELEPESELARRALERL
jgi:tetratricopeptide (TPR) repeat protein